MDEILMSVELLPLIEGSGDWRNIQKCIRNAFRVQQESLLAQRLEISELNAKFVEFQRQRPQNIGCSKCEKHEARSHTSRSVEREVAKLSEDLLRMNSQLQRKVDTVHMEKVVGSLSKLIPLSTAEKTTPSFFPGDAMSYCQLIAEECAELRRRVDSLDTVRVGDFLTLKDQVTRLISDMSVLPSKEYVELLFESRATKLDVASQLASKADNCQVSVRLDSLCEAVMQQEKDLSLLKLKLGSADVFEADFWQGRADSQFLQPEGRSWITEGRSAAGFHFLASAIKTLQEEITLAKKDLEASFSRLEEIDVESQNHHRATLEEMESFRILLESQRNSSDSLREDSPTIRALSLNLSQLEQDVVKVNGSLCDHDSSLQALSTTVEASRSGISRLSERTDDLKHRLDFIKVEMDSMSSTTTEIDIGLKQVEREQDRISCVVENLATDGCPGSVSKLDIVNFRLGIAKEMESTRLQVEDLNRRVDESAASVRSMLRELCALSLNVTSTNVALDQSEQARSSSASGLAHCLRLLSEDFDGEESSLSPVDQFEQELKRLSEKKRQLKNKLK